LISHTIVALGFTEEEIQVPLGKVIVEVEVKVFEGDLEGDQEINLNCITEDITALGTYN
jgi:methylglyoxal synthase